MSLFLRKRKKILVRRKGISILYNVLWKCWYRIWSHSSEKLALKFLFSVLVLKISPSPVLWASFLTARVEKICRTWWRNWWGIKLFESNGLVLKCLWKPIFDFLKYCKALQNSLKFPREGFMAVTSSKFFSF